jgi:hypothetical protein
MPNPLRPAEKVTKVEQPADTIKVPFPPKQPTK